MSIFFKQIRTFGQWLTTPLGQQFIEAERAVVEKNCSSFFGYHLLLLGQHSFLQCVSQSPILHKVFLDSEKKLENESGALNSSGSIIIARHDKLPIVADGVDVIYLAHTLEQIQNPHEVLREAFRSLRPEGHVLISGFNPFSLWGLTRWLLHYLKPVSWEGRFISTTRLTDWLTLLGFEVEKTEHYFFRPPVNHLGFLKHLQWLEWIGAHCWPFFSGSYIVVARKKIITLTAIRPDFSKKNAPVAIKDIAPVGAAE